MDIADAVEIVRVRDMARSGEARRIREAAGLSRAVVADAVGVEVDTVVKWETGTRVPRAEVALVYGRLLRALCNEVRAS